VLSKNSELRLVSTQVCVDENLWALVPVKALTVAKQRLQRYLGAAREDFALAMLNDVLCALVASKTISRIAIVTADERVAELAQRRGLLLVKETGSCDMNAAIALGVEAIRQNGGRRLVIIPSDIPLLTGPELDRLAGIFLNQAGSCAGEMIGISPSADHGGTNCLFLDVRQEFELCYGPDSFALHCANARSHCQGVISLASPTVAMDMDEPKDVDELKEYCRQHAEFQHTETWKFLHNRDSKRPAVNINEV